MIQEEARSSCLESGHQQGMSGAQCSTSVRSSRVHTVHGKSQSSREDRVSLTLQMGKGDGYKHGRYIARICVRIYPLQSWYIIDSHPNRQETVLRVPLYRAQLFQSLIWRHSVFATGGVRKDVVHTSGKAWLWQRCDEGWSHCVHCQKTAVNLTAFCSSHLTPSYSVRRPRPREGASSIHRVSSLLN